MPRCPEITRYQGKAVQCRKSGEHKGHWALVDGGVDVIWYIQFVVVPPAPKKEE
jgi:hypothetical protein